MNKIIINRGSFRLDEVVFEQGATTIGRASDNSISLNDTAVSSHHAKIVTIFNTSYIEDLDSTNGTLVNGKPVQKHTLHSGDVIAVGNHQLLFQSDNVGQKPSETSETLMLRGNEIKQKLNEFIQAQSEQERKDEQLSTAQTATIDQTETAADSGAVDNDALEDSDPPSAFGTSPSLDREKNKAWLEAKKSPSAAEKSTPTSELEHIKPAAGSKTSPAAENAAHAPKPHAIGNTAAAIKAEVNTTPEPAPSAGEVERSSNKTASVAAISANINTTTDNNRPAAHAAMKTTREPEQNTVDIATAARIATQNRRNTDSGYTTTSNSAMALNRNKSRNKVMPMIWLLIVAVLIVEVVYITYRSLG
ncbi:FHA domain-containing protein [Kaarinaea lacus]